MSEPGRCVDCSAPISFCDHALARLLEPERCYMVGVTEELRAALAASEAERDRVVAALAWYADDAHYCFLPGPDGHTIMPRVEVDGGQRARDALAAQATTEPDPRGTTS